MTVTNTSRMCDNDFSTLFIKNIDQCIINYDNIIVMGDLNFDMLNDKKCQALKDLCDVLDFSQLVSVSYYFSFLDWDVPFYCD
jgi:hypothetical protein